MLATDATGADDELLEPDELDEELLELLLAVTTVGSAAVVKADAGAAALAAASDVSASAERADAAEGFPDDEVVGPASPSCVATTSMLFLFCSFLAGKGTWAAAGTAATMAGESAATAVICLKISTAIKTSWTVHFSSLVLLYAHSSKVSSVNGGFSNLAASLMKFWSSLRRAANASVLASSEVLPALVFSSDMVKTDSASVS